MTMLLGIEYEIVLKMRSEDGRVLGIAEKPSANC